MEFLLGAIPEASVAERVFGSIVAAGSFLAGVYLFVRQRRDASPEGNVIARKLPWRQPVAICLCVLGILVALGVWLDLRQNVRLFIAIWALASFLLVVILICAVGDMFIVRRRATRKKLELLEERRRDLLKDAKTYLTRPLPSERNGS